MNKAEVNTFVFLLFFFMAATSDGATSRREKNLTETANNYHHTYSDFLIFHKDSIHKINFRYNDEKKGLKPYIAPAVLITAGTAIHYLPDVKHNFKNYAREHFYYKGKIDDYLQYAPITAVYTFHGFGIKGKNNFGNVTAIALKSFALNATITLGLKYFYREKNQYGYNYAFPSGHTSKAFTLAQIVHKEYGEKSIWFSIGAYSCAATVGAMRIARQVHWISDVLAGAGIGMLSTELVYLTHQYKWDNNHLKRFDIFPFKLGKQKGITLTYTF